MRARSVQFCYLYLNNVRKHVDSPERASVQLLQNERLLRVYPSVNWVTGVNKEDIVCSSGHSGGDACLSASERDNANS